MPPDCPFCLFVLKAQVEEVGSYFDISLSCLSISNVMNCWIVEPYSAQDHGEISASNEPPWDLGTKAGAHKNKMSQREEERKEIMCLQKGLAFPFCSSKLNRVQKKDLQCSNCSIPCANQHKQKEK